jgi:hypothetical protein
VKQKARQTYSEKSGNRSVGLIELDWTERSFRRYKYFNRQINLNDPFEGKPSDVGAMQSDSCNIQTVCTWQHVAVCYSPSHITMPRYAHQKN